MLSGAQAVDDQPLATNRHVLRTSKLPIVGAGLLVFQKNAWNSSVSFLNSPQLLKATLDEERGRIKPKDPGSRLQALKVQVKHAHHNLECLAGLTTGA